MTIVAYGLVEHAESVREAPKPFVFWLCEIPWGKFMNPDTVFTLHH